MLKEYLHMYLPSTSWIISETRWFGKRKREGGGVLNEKNTSIQGENQSLRPSGHLSISN